MKKHYIQNKKVAEEIIKKWVHHFASLYNVKVERVSIRNQKTRWGSCSKHGNLNFNYKLIYLPQDQKSYVIVHELCHLIEFNHSRRFWVQVEHTIPKHKEIRRKLRFTHMSKLGVCL